MNVLRAKSAGFCFGVSLALKALDKEIEYRIKNIATTSYNLFTFGPIIHNPLVMEAYAAKGVLCLEDINKVRSGDHVVIRAHGIPKEQEICLQNSGAIVIDATCPKVKMAQLSIATEAERAKSLLLFGEKEHPEVQGLISYAGGKAVVFSTIEELKQIKFSPTQTYFLAAQTTQDLQTFEEAKQIITAKLGGTAPLTLRTICNATKKRQEEAIEIAQHVDAMVVVGGLNSGNTRRLALVATSQNIPAYHIEDPNSLNLSLFKGMTSIGLTAGASTPNEHIDIMEALLKALH